MWSQKKYKNCMDCGISLLDEWLQGHVGKQCKSCKIKGNNLITKECLICKTAFASKSKRHVCCGTNCSRLSGIRRKYGTPHCLNCGKEFWQSSTKGTNAHCSRKCRWEYQKKHKKIVPKKINYHNCQVCNALFISNRPNTKVCCEECKKIYRIEWDKSYLESKHKAQGFKCRECEKEWQSSYGDKRRSFCSRKCGRRNSKRVYRQKKRLQLI